MPSFQCSKLLLSIPQSVPSFQCSKLLLSIPQSVPSFQCSKLLLSIPQSVPSFQCSKLLLSIPQSVPSFVMFLCVCVYIHAAILLCYVKIAPLMLATVAGRILLLVCCLRAVMLMLGSHFYRIMRNDTF